MVVANLGVKASIFLVVLVQSFGVFGKRGRGFEGKKMPFLNWKMVALKFIFLAESVAFPWIVSPFNFAVWLFHVCM